MAGYSGGLRKGSSTLGTHPSTVLSIQTEKAGIPSTHERSQHTKEQQREKYFKAASSPCSKLHQCDCLRWREWGFSASWGLHWSLKLRAFLKPTAHSRTCFYAFISKWKTSPHNGSQSLSPLAKTKRFPFRHQVSAIKGKHLYFGKAEAISPQVTQQNFHCIKDMSQDLNKTWKRTAGNVFVFKHAMNCILLLGTQCLIRLCVIKHGDECLLLFRDYSNYSKKHLWYV